MANPTPTRICTDCGSRYLGECGICLDAGIDQIKDSYKAMMRAREYENQKRHY